MVVRRRRPRPSECGARPRGRCRGTGRPWRDPRARAAFCRRAMSSLTESSRLARLLQRRATVGGAAALAEQALEDDARMRLGRQRRRRRRPREVVLIDAGVAVVALADRLEQIHRQLERRQLRLLADLLRGDLIDRGAEVVVGALGPLRLRRAEERGVRGRVRAGIGVLQLQVRDDRELIGDRRERLERRRELVEPALARRRPARRCRSPSACRRSRGGAPARPASCASAVIDGTIASSSGSATRRAQASQERPARQEPSW